MRLLEGLIDPTGHISRDKFVHALSDHMLDLEECFPEELLAFRIVLPNAAAQATAANPNSVRGLSR
jgi:hypothetical protein